MKRFYLMAFGALTFISSDAASACPLCHSSIADEVRAGLISTAQDASVLLALVGPFAVLGILIGLYNRFTPDQ